MYPPAQAINLPSTSDNAYTIAYLVPEGQVVTLPNGEMGIQEAILIQPDQLIQAVDTHTQVVYVQQVLPAVTAAPAAAVAATPSTSTATDFSALNPVAQDASTSEQVNL